MSAPGGDRGTAALIVFGLAALVIVAVVWAVGASGSWWILAPAMAVHFLMTGLVLFVIWRLLDDGDDTGHQPH